jgi:hypothetical protein
MVDNASAGVLARWTGISEVAMRDLDLNTPILSSARTLGRTLASRRTVSGGSPKSVTFHLGDFVVPEQVGVGLYFHRPQHVDERIVRVWSRFRQSVKIARALSIRGTHN